MNGWCLCWYLSIACTAQGIAQTEPSSTLTHELATLPTEMFLAEGSLSVINLYKLQAKIIGRLQAHSTAETVDQLVREVYLPFSSFWHGYLGDEAEFRKWAETSLLDNNHPIHTQLPSVLNLQLDTLFTQATKWLIQVSDKRPRGTWYIVFGPGWTDMGSLGEVGMVLDFTQQKPKRDVIEFLLPHELAHQIHETRGHDPDRGTVLERIISEGLACYAAHRYAEGRQTLAQIVGYSDEDWKHAVAHESELISGARPYLDSRERKNIDRLVARKQRLIEVGPGAAGYFLGFRIMERYVEQGNIWTEAFGIPVREVLVRSGYPLLP